MVKTNKVIANGGGAMQNNANQPQKTLKNTRLFKPLVASSLALFLSASMANAAVKSCTLGAGDVKICYDQNEGNPWASDNLREATGLNDLTWSGSGDTLTPQASGTSISQLIFNFNTGTRDPQGSVNGSSYSVNFGQSDLKQVIIVDGGTKSIEIPTLQVNFGTGTDSKREFHLNLSKATGEFSFKGNINIYAGKGDGTTSEFKNAKFVGEFGKKVVGDIKITNQNEGNKSNHRTNLTFANGASLEGNLTTQAGITTATFANGNITGNVETGNSTGADPQATNNIIFNGQDNKIGGNVTATTSKASYSIARNNITFNGNGAIGGDISAFMGPGSSTGKNFNKITFAKNGTIKGNVTTDGQSFNTIKADNDTLTIGSSGATNIIKASGGYAAKNTISARDLTISTSVVSEISNGNAANTNSITATNLTLSGDKIEVSGDFSSKTNGNTFTITESADIKTNTIKATYGTNSITAKDLNLGVKTLEANGTKDNISITNNEIVVRGHGKLEANHIKATSASNKFTFKDGGYSSLTIHTELKAENGFNTFTIENAGLMFNLASTATTTAYNNGQNTILLKQGGKFLTTNNKLSFQNLVFDKVKFDENQAGQNTLAQSLSLIHI